MPNESETGLALTVESPNAKAIMLLRKLMPLSIAEIKQRAAEGRPITGFNDLDEYGIKYREDGLPGNLLVVENCDEWLYCIDADSGEVVSWYFDDEQCVDYPCFDDYLVDRLNDAVENL